MPGPRVLPAPDRAPLPGPQVRHRSSVLRCEQVRVSQEGSCWGPHRGTITDGVPQRRFVTGSPAHSAPWCNARRRPCIRHGRPWWKRRRRLAGTGHQGGRRLVPAAARAAPNGWCQRPLLAAWYCSIMLAGIRPRSQTAIPWSLARARMSPPGLGSPGLAGVLEERRQILPERPWRSWRSNRSHTPPAEGEPDDLIGRAAAEVVFHRDNYLRIAAALLGGVNFRDGPARGAEQGLCGPRSQGDPGRHLILVLARWHLCVVYGRGSGTGLAPGLRQVHDRGCAAGHAAVPAAGARASGVWLGVSGLASRWLCG